MSDSDRLTTNQRKALEALLTESSVRAAATAAGLGEATLYRYLNDEFFTSELRRRQQAILSATTAALCGLSSKALDALIDVLDSSTATEAVKTRAALGWLKQTRQSVELDNLLERLERLEALLNER
jgi:predicted xylose isomerase-like sugar epimerase